MITMITIFRIHDYDELHPFMQNYIRAILLPVTNVVAASMLPVHMRVLCIKAAIKILKYGG